MRVYSRTSLSCLRSIPFCRSSSGAGKSDLDVMDVHVTRQNLSLLLPEKHSTNIQRKNGKQEKSKAIFDLQETPERSDDIPSKIEKGLFLGSCAAAFNEKRLKYLKVTHILTVRKSDSTPYPNDFKYKTIKVNDRPQENIRCHFYECFQFIDEARKGGGGILVHCRAGVSRSATIVIAYLMKTRKMNLGQALDYVQRRRPKIKPNEGFMAQLREFENSLAVQKPQLPNSMKPVAILETREKVLRKKVVQLVRVLWGYHNRKKETWELEEKARKKYPHLF